MSGRVGVGELAWASWFVGDLIGYLSSTDSKDAEGYVILLVK